MAADIEAIMAAIQVRLNTITGLNTSPFMPKSGGVTPPMAVVGVPPIPNYHETMQHGFFELEFPITLLVSGALDQKSQADLASFASPGGANSFLLAFEGDKQLGATVEDSMLVDFRPLGTEEVNLIGYQGGLFTLKVAVKGA
jgi:hypothetical protein